MRWVIRQSKDDNIYWKENDPNMPQGIGVSGVWIRDRKNATRFNEDQRLAYIAENGALPSDFHWEVIAKRHQDAIDVQNAVNPAGVSWALHQAFREVIAEGGDTKAQQEDPACRLILHQLTYLLGMRGVDDLSEYRKYLAQCETAARHEKGQ